jgi:hypothetical protein
MFKFNIGDRLVLVNDVVDGWYQIDANSDALKVGDMVTVYSRSLYDDNPLYGFSPYSEWLDVEENFITIQKYRERKLERILNG